MRQQRRNLITAALDVLSVLALADGALAVYTFVEGSGNLINRANPGTFDLSVDGTVTRSYAGADPADLLAYRFPDTGAATLYGHAQGLRADASASTAFTCEAVLKVVTNPGADRTLIHLDRNAGATLSDCSFSSGNTNLLASVLVAGQSINNQPLSTASTGEYLAYAHYVWQWDGGNFRTWRNAANKANVAIGPGSTGMASGSAPYNIALGGFYNFGGANIDCAIDFFAYYPTVHLTAAQIARHAAAAGT